MTWHVMRMVLALAVALVFAFAMVAQSGGNGPKDYSGNCSDAGCHGEFTKKPVIHGPVNDGACDGCHVEKEGTKKHAFKLISTGLDLCIDCHDEFEGESIHAPVAGGECTVCHDPHASAHPKLLRAAKVATLCNECHEEVTEDREYLHGPVAAGSCTNCHDPHASDHAALLRSTGRDLCFTCHDPMKQQLTPDTKVHAPVRDGCTDCHDPHGADNKMMTREEGPDLCLQCHDDIADAIEASVPHSAVTQGDGCLACHDPHMGKYAKLLVAREQDLCMSCHAEAIETPAGALPGFKKLLADNPTHHGPIDDGDCTVCHHDIHGSEQPRLLGMAYPQSMYAPYSDESYALCLDCHDSEAFTEATTDEATQFRNGDQNLHHMHVGRAKKGRTCRVCHDVHATKGLHLLKTSVPFGEWQLPIGFESTTNGGSCAPGCHRPYRYDRKQAVVNIAKPGKTPPVKTPPVKVPPKKVPLKQ